MRLSSKGTTLALVCFWVLVPILSSCGQSASTSNAGTDTILSILHITGKSTPSGAPFQQILHDFGTQNHVTIQQAISPNNAPEVYETALLAGKEPDVMMPAAVSAAAFSYLSHLCIDVFQLLSMGANN